MSEVINAVQVLNSNIIQIKRGTGKPDKKLAPYELGIDIKDGQLYYGGSLLVIEKDDETEEYEYGDAKGIRVDKANEANVAIKLGTITIGTNTTPIYLDQGKPKACQSFIPVKGGTFTGQITVPSLVGTENELWGSNFPTTNLVDGRIFFKIN